MKPLVTVILLPALGALAIVSAWGAPPGQPKAVSGPVADQAKTTALPHPEPTSTEEGPISDYAQPSPPPYLLEQIQQLQQQQQGQKAVHLATLSPTHRIILLVVAAVVLAAGMFLCHWLATVTPVFASLEVRALVLGVFGAVAALTGGAAVVGCIYMHLAAAACLVVSGFTLTTLLAAHLGAPGRCAQNKGR